MTRVALKRRIDAGRLMAQLASAFTFCCMPQLRLSHMCHRERGVRGVSSVVCYAVLCPWSGGLCGLLCRVMPWSGGRVLFSGDFSSDQGTGPEQQGTIWDKE